MKVMRKDLYGFYSVLGSARFEQPIRTAFRYMLSKNMKKAKAEIDETDALFPAPAGYSEYFTARHEIFTEYGIAVSDTGVVNVDDINAMEPSRFAEMNDKLSRLVSDNSELLDQVKILNDEKTKFLEEEIEVDFETVKLADAPDISESNGDKHWEIWRLLELVVVK